MMLPMLLLLALDPSFVVAAHSLVIAHPPSSSFLNGKATRGISTTFNHCRTFASRRYQRNDFVGYDNDVILGMVRGGGSDDEDVGDDDESLDEYDVGTSDDETRVEEEIEEVAVEVDGGDDDLDKESSASSSSSSSRGMDIGGASAQQQSRNFGIVTALWASLVFDVLLNKSKRAELFPIMIAAASTSSPSSSTSALVPTALLSSGFALASGVAFLLWRDMENRADIESDEGGNDGSRMGDWFLSLSSRATTDGVASASYDGERAAASRTIRARLLLHMAVFGALCLAGQSAGYHLSSRAPFLGLSAAAVNLHNVLACVSALMKEEGGSAMMVRAAMTRPVRSLLSEERKDRDRHRLELTPFLFRLGAVVACVRCIPVCKFIFTLASGILSGGVTESTAIASDARQLSLQVASLARLTLFAGASNALYTSFSAYHSCFRHHPFFATLSGMLGLGCLSVGGAMLFESVVSLSSSQAPLGGVLLMTFGMFASWNSVMGFERHLRRSALTGKQGVKS